MVSPATGHVDTEWFDEFWEECLILECRIDYIATHQYKGTIDERMKELKDYSLRYGKQIWLTEFALALGTIHILLRKPVSSTKNKQKLAFFDQQVFT